MKLMNKKQAGFTLIELIIVIVILGILAVTAAPKFLDLQGDAKKSTLQGIDGAINGAMSVVYGKSIIAGTEKLDNQTVETIVTDFGYPNATTSGIVAAMELSGDIQTGVNGADATEFLFYPNGASSDPASGCVVIYKEAPSSAAAASTEIIDAGC